MLTGFAVPNESNTIEAITEMSSVPGDAFPIRRKIDAFFRRSTAGKLDWINQSSLPEALATCENKAASVGSIVPESPGRNSAPAFLRPEEAALCPRTNDDERPGLAYYSGGAGYAHRCGCRYQLVQRISSLLSRQPRPSTLPSSARDRADKRASVGQNGAATSPASTPKRVTAR